MENLHLIQDMIDRYIRGEMTQAEKTSFLEQVQADAELKAELVLQEEIYGALQHAGNTELRKKLNTFQREISPANQTGKIISMRMLWRVAAVILIFLIPAYFLFFNTSSSDKLYKKYYVAYETSLTVRGANEAALQEIDELYNGAQYAAVLEKIHAFGITDTLPAQLLLVKGICEMEMGKDEEASETFAGIIKRNDPYFTDHALWYAALAELKTSDKENCRQLLNQLLARSKPDHEKEAEELLEKLN